MVALLFAYLLMPVVGFVKRFTPARVSVNVALAIVYLVLIGVMVALAFTVGSRIADEANNLANKLPELLRNRQWIDTLPLPSVLEPVRARIAQALQSELDNGARTFCLTSRASAARLFRAQDTSSTSYWFRFSRSFF